MVLHTSANISYKRCSKVAIKCTDIGSIFAMISPRINLIQNICSTD